MKKASRIAFVLGGLVVALLICLAIVSVAPDGKACNMFTEMLATEIKPADVLAVYVGRLPKNQRERVYVGDLSGQHSLFTEVWELRGKQVELSDQFKALMADYKQKAAQRKELYEKQAREAKIKQNELELKIERIRMEQWAGTSGLTADEAREQLGRLDIQWQEIKLELLGQKRSMLRQDLAHSDEIIPQLEALQEELQPLDKELTEKSRALLERERDQTCNWFGRWGIASLEYDKRNRSRIVAPISDFC